MGGKPPVLKYIYFSKEKKMQNVLKRKYVFGRISSYFEFFLTKLYVLDNSEFKDMHIEK